MSMILIATLLWYSHIHAGRIIHTMHSGSTRKKCFKNVNSCTVQREIWNLLQILKCSDSAFPSVCIYLRLTASIWPQSYQTFTFFSFKVFFQFSVTSAQQNEMSPVQQVGFLPSRLGAALCFFVIFCRWKSLRIHFKWTLFWSLTCKEK